MLLPTSRIMNAFKSLRRFVVTLVSLALLGCTAFGQMPAGSPVGVSATLTKFFGDLKEFSAKATVRVLDKAQTETMNTPMDFALLDGRIRVDFDLTKMQKMPPEAAQQLRQMGMEKVSAIIRPDKKEMYLLVHVMQSTVTMPLPAEEAEAIDKPPKVEKSELGKETIDGHPCVKNKLTLTDAKGQKRDAPTWNASDQKDFPVQIQTTEKDNTLILRFSQVQFAKPEAKQFEPPAGYTKYSDMQEMMMGAAAKALGGQSGK